MIKKFITHSESETFSLGKNFAEKIFPIQNNLTVLMFGDLGTGKTVFVRGVGEALGVKNVRSPSFTLINEYKTKYNNFLVHADLYRLDENSVFSLGLEDYDNDFLLIEWSERLTFPLSDNVLKISFKAIDENTRSIEFFSDNPEIIEKL